jgi:hypothetical protein
MNPSVASWGRQQRTALLMKGEAMTTAVRAQAVTAIVEKLDCVRPNAEVRSLGSITIFPQPHDVRMDPILTESR